MKGTILSAACLAQNRRLLPFSKPEFDTFERRLYRTFCYPSGPTRDLMQGVKRYSSCFPTMPTITMLGQLRLAHLFVTTLTIPLPVCSTQNHCRFGDRHTPTLAFSGSLPEHTSCRRYLPSLRQRSRRRNLDFYFVRSRMLSFWNRSLGRTGGTKQGPFRPQHDWHIPSVVGHLRT